MQAPSPTTLTFVALVPLIAWRVYSRMRRMVGRQRLSKVRPWITLALFPLLIALFAWGTHNNPEGLAWLALGVACGGALSVLGLRLTEFEPTPTGLYYTPHSHLGIALTLVFVARIAYRFYEVYAHGVTVAGPDFVASRLTLAVFGLLAGYYIGYAFGLVRWRMAVMEREREPAAIPVPAPDHDAQS